MTTHEPAVAPIRVVVVDNHQTILRGVQSLADDHPEVIVIEGLHEAVEEIDLSQPPPDVVVLDLLLGRDDRLSTPFIQRLVGWGALVLLHTSEEKPVPLREAVLAGASGMSLKNDGPDALLEAIVQVNSSGFAVSSALAQALLTDERLVPSLSPREIEVLQAVDDGLSHKQIARRLDIAPSTVKTHITKACRRYEAIGRNVTNTVSVARLARDDGWFGPR